MSVASRVQVASDTGKDVAQEACAERSHENGDLPRCFEEVPPGQEADPKLLPVNVKPIGDSFT